MSAKSAEARGLVLASSAKWECRLPLATATRRLAILAMSGAGKSNVAVVLAEQMAIAGIPWVAIDPKGDWYGIRSNRSGKGPGLPVPIFGGLHGDVPIEPTPEAGRTLADVIVDQRLTCVVDISEFTDRQAMWGFLAAFGETLLRRNRQPLHLFLEEADEYLPQKTSEKGNLPKCLGVWQRVVKRGRFRGLGSTQITQRNAALNKDTLYQAELLIALRATGKADREAVRGYLDHTSGSRDIVDTLPSLEDGEGWITSPAWLRRTERVRFDRRTTFDSGSTPDVMLVGAQRGATLAPVDLTALRSKMAATFEKAKADDPRELRKLLADKDKRIKQLEANAPKQSQNIPSNIPAKPLLTDADRALLERLHGRIAELVARLSENRAARADDFLASVGVALQEAMGNLTSDHQRTCLAGAKVLEQKGFQKILNKLAAAQTPAPVVRQSPVERPRQAPSPRPTASRTPPLADGSPLPPGELATLTAALQYASGLDKKRLSVLTGYKRSSRDAYILRLRGKGLVEERGQMLYATEAGRAALNGSFQPLPTGSDLISYWMERLPEGEAKVFDVLVAAGGADVDRDAIDEKTGYKRSSRDAYLTRLKARGIVTFSGRGMVRASAELFEAG